MKTDNLKRFLDKIGCEGLKVFFLHPLAQALPI